MTAQTLAVLLVGAALGARAGAASLVAYVLAGACGAPVFAGATAGPAVVFGPGGGYLLGFVLAAALVGYAVDSGFSRSFARRALVMLAGAAAIFLPGLVWLSLMVGSKGAVDFGFVPFALVEAGKLALGAALLPLVRRARA